MPAIQYVSKTVITNKPISAAASPPTGCYTARSTDDELRQGCLDHHRLAQKYLYQR